MLIVCKVGGRWLAGKKQDDMRTRRAEVNGMKVDPNPFIVKM